MKLITKTIANRLKSIHLELIDEEQSAFVHGRQITDNALIAMKCFHWLKKKNKGKKGVMALKLDMSKSNDWLEWSFMVGVLEAMGFPNSLVELIRSCISTVSYQILLNGQPDDCLLFCRASTVEADGMMDILYRYQVSSGQMVNMEKSEVSFSRNDPDHCKDLICNRMRVKTVENHSKYLGLPVMFGRSRKDVISFVMDQVWKKMKDWKEKFLSKVDKEGSKNGERKIHWVSWDNLSRAKGVRGLGFRGISNFNVSLLGKQFLRLQTDIISACSKWSIGNGESVKIWGDNWLPGSSCSRVLSSARVLNKEEFVSSLFDKDLLCWKRDLVETCLVPFDAPKFLSILLSMRNPTNKFIWSGESNNNYSVRSTYKLLAAKRHDSVAGSSSPPHQNLWKLV
ncbi:uncharacterized protein LOC131636069 [Vicia villosa]|uniref:uncharacterized protein LOC131636069 n=1 Tax=Vicia villosa TaxID=3911 RepID=UPI00273BC423|nr:uncharacterized protein LOC131636069 [Vicia villosa]